MIVPVHTVLQGTSSDIAVHGACQIEFTGATDEPLDDGRVERLGEGLSCRLI